VRPFARRTENGMVMVEPRRTGMALFTLRTADEVQAARSPTSRFVADSLLEEAVTSEPVSDIRLPGIGADSRVIMGDSGSPKRCFAPRNGPKLNRLQF
jgi:hypothetical protein